MKRILTIGFLLSMASASTVRGDSSPADRPPATIWYDTREKPRQYPDELRTHPKLKLPNILGESLIERFELGIRLSYFRLLDDTRSSDDSFLGSITKLDEVDNLEIIDALVAHIRFNSYLGVELSSERITAKAITSGDNHADGIFMLNGPVLSVTGCLPNRTRFTPFVGIGIAWLSAGMKHSPVWHNGFGGDNKEADYKAWLAAGSPEWPNNGYQRTLDPGSASGLALTLGLSALFQEKILAEVFVRYTDVSTDTHYYLSRRGEIFDDRGYTTFPMSNIAIGMGVRYAF